MRQECHYRIVSDSPLLMHNIRLANPLDFYAREIKKISAKRDKTEADFEQMSKLEWYGGLYLSDGKPCLPGEVIEGTLINAAKKRKKVPQAKAGLVCPVNVPLLYNGPTDPEILWDNEQFRFVAGVRINGSRVMRTRAIFHAWEADVHIMFNDELLNKSDVEQFLRSAGESIGVGDWRPKFGRFHLA